MFFAWRKSTWILFNLWLLCNRLIKLKKIKYKISNVATEFLNQQFALLMKYFNFYFQNQSLNTIYIWKNQIKTLSNNYTICFFDQIVIIDNLYLFFIGCDRFKCFQIVKLIVSWIKHDLFRILTLHKQRINKPNWSDLSNRKHCIYDFQNWKQFRKKNMQIKTHKKARLLCILQSTNSQDSKTSSATENCFKFYQKKTWIPHKLTASNRIAAG